MSDAIRKGGDAAKKNMMRVKLDGKTIPHAVTGVCDGGRVLLKPAPDGTGLIVGGGMRPLLEAAGVRDAVGKSLGSKNRLNVVKATVDALNQLRSKEEIAAARAYRMAEQFIWREKMDLSSLRNTPGARKTRKRVGRGPGSGLGKTAGKGQKGQMSRKGHKQKLGFEGGQMPLIRRLPKRGFKNVNRKEYLAMNVSTLERYFEDGAEVTLETISAKGLLGAKYDGVKVLAKGELTKKLTVKVNGVSAAAKAKIEAAGGTVLPMREGPSLLERCKAAGKAARDAAKAAKK